MPFLVFLLYNIRDMWRSKQSSTLGNKGDFIFLRCRSSCQENACDSRYFCGKLSMQYSVLGWVTRWRFCRPKLPAQSPRVNKPSGITVSQSFQWSRFTEHSLGATALLNMSQSCQRRDVSGFIPFCCMIPYSYPGMVWMLWFTVQQAWQWMFCRENDYCL